MGYVFSFFFFVFPVISFAKFHSILLFVLAFSIISCSQFPFLFPRYIDVLLFWFLYFLFNNRSSLWGAFIFLALLHVLFFTRLNSIILFPYLSIHGAAIISSFPFFPICIFFDLFKCFSCVTPC